MQWIMTKPALLPVDEARSAIIDSLSAVSVEQLTPDAAHHRYLAADISASLDHPAAAVSAMDGYCLASSDRDALSSKGLKIIGESAAGRPFAQPLGQGEAVRIFTGALLPQNADMLLIQEEADLTSGRLMATEIPVAGRYIRQRAQDFGSGDQLISAGTKLTMRHLALAALAGITSLTCHRRPRIAIATTGDELVPPGQTPLPGQLVNSNSLFLTHFVRAAGAEPVELGILPDKASALHAALSAAGPLDLIVTTGGASVGDHDHIVSDLDSDPASSLNFWKIAMRPGKPLIWANWRGTPFLGLPGNPVSAAICALQFLGPAIDRLSGGTGQIGSGQIGTGQISSGPFSSDQIGGYFKAKLTTDLPENDKRQDYLRATLTHDCDGTVLVTPANRQDSAMMHKLALADCLIIRPPFAEPLSAGDWVECQAFPAGF